MKIIRMDIATASQVLPNKSLWEANGLDVNKTAIICGQPGNGKTTLMKEIVLPTLPKGHEITGREINDEYENFGYRDQEDRKSKFKYWKEHGMYIDDLGNEPSQVAHYNALDQPVVRVLEERYATKSPTWITTNKNIEDLEAKYGARVVDRLCETCNIIYITSPSFRRI